jgi:hypothetical protein
MILTHGANSISVIEKSHLPEHCVLLDYFIDDCHYGIQRESSTDDYGPTFIASSEYDELGTRYFDTSGTPWNNLPYMRMWKYNNGVNDWHKRIIYKVPFNEYNEYTVEILAAIGSVPSPGCQIFTLGPLYNLFIGDTSPVIKGAYLLEPSGASASFFNGYGESISYSYNPRNSTSWHHYCYTKSNITGTVKIYLDGNLIYEVTSIRSNNNIELAQCPVKYTDGRTLIDAPYYVAQLAVWDEIHYTSNFTVPSRLHYV